MKLTPELIAQAPSYLNAVKERQLELRGHNIPAIENLGVAHDQHDCVDLTDNAIVALANFPLLRRLKTLLIGNNRVSSISTSLHLSCPNLTSLILSSNNISELGDLEPLKDLRNLKYLTLLSNPVRERKWYREWLVYRLRSLRVLDYERIRDKERTSSKALFLSQDGTPTSLALALSSAISQSSKVPLPIDEPRPAATVQGKAGRLMTPEEKLKVKLAITNANSAEEVRKLEQQLQEGWMPR